MENNIIPEGYKQTEVGVIPDDWTVDSFDRICNVNQGLQIPIEQRKKNLSVHSKVYITIKSIGSNDDPEYIDEYSKSVCCDSDDVLMTRTGNTGIVVTGVNGVFHNNFFKINFDRNEINAKYFVYYLRSRDCQKSILDKAGTSTIPDLNHGDFYSIQMAYPVFKEQTAIANALSDVDALIASIEKLIAKKQAIKTATMQQLLTGKKRLPPFDIYQKTDLAVIQGDKKTGQSKGTQQTELGEIPEDWELKTYEEIFHFLTTASNSRSDLSQSGDCYYIHYGDIHTKWDNCLNINATPVPQISLDKVKNTPKLKDADLIMADASEDYAGIGKSIEIVGLNGKDGVSGLHTFLLRDKSDTYVDGFKGYLHEIKAVKATFDKLATGLKVYGLSKNSLRTILLPVPCKSEQQVIINIITDMDLSIQSLKERLAKTQQIKQGMMQELLTGKTRLPVAGITAGEAM
jgi:type I restriction enzyme S subunit